MTEIEDLLDSLRRAPRILSAFIHAIPADKMTWRRGVGFWTVAEHLSHLAAVQPMLLARFARFMAEEQPEFVPFFPGESNEEVAPLLTTETALNQFAQYRVQQLTLLADADRATWQKKGIHPEYTAYSLAILTRHVLMHDYWHMYRMEELWLTKDAYLTRLA